MSQPYNYSGAVWEKVTKGRAGIRWDSVVEKYGRILGEPRRLGVRRGFGRYKAERKDKKKGKASAKKQGGIGNTLGDIYIYGGLREGIGMKIAVLNSNYLFGTHPAIYNCQDKFY